MTCSGYQKSNKFVELIHQCNERLSKIHKTSIDIEKEQYLYYFYCKGGLYNDEDGDYFKVDNFGELTLQQCIDYINECRKTIKQYRYKLPK